MWKVIEKISTYLLQSREVNDGDVLMEQVLIYFSWFMGVNFMIKGASNGSGSIKWREKWNYKGHRGVKAGTKDKEL